MTPDNIKFSKFKTFFIICIFLGIIFSEISPFRICMAGFTIVFWSIVAFMEHQRDN